VVSEDILEKLHEHEKIIIKALLDGEQTVEKLAEATGLKKDSIEKASLWAKAKGVIKQRKDVSEFLEMTEEGRRYLKEGLPEKKLIKHINEGKESLDNLRKTELFNIGLQWAKFNNWISIEGDEVELTSTGKKALTSKIPEEMLLEGLEKRVKLDKVKADKKLIEKMLRRKLVRKVQEKKRWIELTSKGKKIAPEISLGEEAAQLTSEIIKSGRWKKLKLRKYDVKLTAPKIQPGKIQAYRQIIDEIREKLIGLGFEEARGPLVETSFWNMDALFMPQDHPARGIHDAYFVKEPKYGKILDEELAKRVKETHENGWITGSKGWGGKYSFDVARRLLLRTQTTALSARNLANLDETQIPKKIFTIDRNFRPDVIDAKHFVEFDQLEGIVVGKDLNLRNLLGYLKAFADIVGAKEVRFKPGYFPFTEPSVEGFVYFKELGWVECLASGIFRPEVTLPLGTEVPVLAWGIGIGRLAMYKLGINDFRMLLSDDLDWLRKKELVR